MPVEQLDSVASALRKRQTMPSLLHRPVFSRLAFAAPAWYFELGAPRIEPRREGPILDLRRRTRLPRCSIDCIWRGLRSERAGRAPRVANSGQRLYCLDQLRDVDRVREGGILHMPRDAGQGLVGFALEQDDVFKPEHGAEMRRPRVVLALGDDLDDLCLRRAEIDVRQSGAELAHDDLPLSEQKRLFVERELVRLDRDETEGFERLDHRSAIGDVSAV